MKDKGNKRVRQMAKWDKRLVLVVEGALLIIFFILFYYGVMVDNDTLSGVFSNAFTGLLVTFAGTLISFNTESETERVIRENDEYTEKMQGELEKVVSLLDDSVSNLKHTAAYLKGKSCVFCASQISDVKPSRVECDLTSLFSGAREEISVFTINLRSFIPYLSDLQYAAKRGVSVRISAMHPAFAKQYNALRFIDGDPPEQRWRDMKGALMQFISAEEFLNGNNFTVRTYTNIAPTLVMIIVDGICCTSYLLNGKHSSETIHLLFKKTVAGEFVCPYTYLKNHYESVWQDGDACHPSLEEIVSLSYDDVSKAEV